MINLLKRLNWSSFSIIVTIVSSSNIQFEFRCIHELGVLQIGTRAMVIEKRV